MKILYIEDDPSHIELTKRSLETRAAEFELYTAATLAEALPLLDGSEYDVILTDHLLPDGTGLDVIQHLCDRGLSTAVVLITNQGDINTAVAALKAGAVDYVVKQSDYLHKLPIVLTNAQIKTQLAKQQVALRESEQKYRSMYATVERQAQELTLLDKVRTALAHELDLPTLIKLVVDSIADTFGYTLVSLYLLKEDRLILQHQVGYKQEVREILVTEGVIGGVVRSQKPILLEDVRTAPHFIGAIEGIVSEICIPLFEEGQVVGALNVESTQGIKLTEADLDLIMALGEHISVAMRRARLYTQAQNELAERKVAETALRESERRYRALVENSPIGIGVVNRQGNFLTFNEAILRPGEYTRADILQIGKVENLYYDPQDRGVVLRLLNEHGRVTKHPVRFKRKDGTAYQTLLTLTPIEFEGQEAIMALVEDVSEQAKYQEALQASEEKFTKVFHNSPIAISITSWDEGIYVDANPAFYALSGYSKEDLIGKSVLDLGYVTSEFRRAFLNELETGDHFKILEDVFTTKSGESRNTRVFYEKIYLNGEPCLLSMLYDITEQKNIEGALRESEERYRHLVELSPEGIIVHHEGHIVFANSASAKLVGAEKAEDLIGKPVLSFVHPDSYELALQRIQSMLSEGVSQPIAQEKFLRLDGSLFDVEVIASPIVYRGKNSVQVFIRDITEKKISQEILERQLKELTVLHAAAVAAAQSLNEDEIIEQTTKITSSIYTDVCGILLLSSKKDILTPHPSYVGADVHNWLNGYPTTEGITGRSVREGRAIRIADITKDPAYIEIASGVKSELCVPICVYQHIIGVINVESKRADAFDENDEQLLNTIAGSLGAALERLRLFKAEQDQLQREAALLELMRVAASSLDLDLVLQSILNQLIKVIPSDSGTIQLLEKDQLTVVASIGSEGTYFAEQSPIRLSEHPLKHYVITEKKPIHIDNTLLNNYRTEFSEITNVKSFLGIPLLVKGEPIGMLTLESYETAHFTEQDEEMGIAIANHASIAIENARLFEAEQQRRKQAEILREVTVDLTTSISPDRLFEIVLDALAKLVPYDSASIEMVVDRGLFEIVAGRNIPGKLIGKKYETSLSKWGGVEKIHQPIIVDDVHVEPRFEKFENTEYIRGWMGVPLFAQGELLGYLNLDSKTPGFFNEEHAAVTQTFANQVGIAMENARLFQEERHRSQIIEALANIANEIATTREVIPALDKIAERTLALLNATTVAIYLLQDDDETIKVVTAQGGYRDELLSHTIKAGEGITGSVIANGKPEIIDNIANDRRRKTVPGTSEEDARLDTMMSAPLILRGKTIGAINAWRLRSSGYFNTSELNFLVSIAHQASISIESGRLFQEISRRAQEAAAIAEVGRDISATLQLDNVLERIALYAKNLLRAETSAVYLSEPSTPLLRATAAIGIDSEEIKNDPIRTGRGILGNIALSKSGEIVNDTVADPRTVQIKGTQVNPLEHIMGVPVLLKEKLTGLLVVWRTGVNEEFKAVELDFLSSLAQQAAVAIENARLYAETHRQLEEQQVISLISYSLRVAKNSQEMLTLLLDQILSAMGTDTASIWLYDSNQNELVQSVAKGWLSKLPKTTFKYDEGIVGHVYLTGELRISQEFLTDPLSDPENTSVFGKGWGGVTIPLRTTTDTIGVLTVSLPSSRPIEEHHTQLLSTIAEITGNAIQRASLFEHSERQVQRLTALRELDTMIASSFDLKVTLNVLTNHLLNQLGASAAAVLIYNPDQQSLNYLTGAGFRTSAITQTSLEVGGGFAGKVLIERKDVYLENIPENIKNKRNSLFAQEEFVSYYALPLVSKGIVKGVLETYFRQKIMINADWLSFLHILAGQATIAIDNSQLFENLQRSNQELSLAYDTTLEGWGKALELRDKETQGHTRRVADLTIKLAREMGISESDLVQIRRGVLLHDIGKMGIPDSILRKKGPLTKKEWREMRKHPQYAHELLASIPYLRPVIDIPYCHHEWWDGSGYPRGLSGEEIPLSARIFTVVDVWDALLSDRPYRKPWTKRRAISYLKKESGKHFDPKIVQMFLSMIEKDAK